MNRITVPNSENIMADPKPVPPPDPVPPASVDHDYATKGGGPPKVVIKPPDK
jgi:hypothetical protein